MTDPKDVDPRVEIPYPTEEPPASTREMAMFMRQVYVALLQAGFTKAEAIAIMGEMLRSNRPDGG